jgi:hypothetical protein
MPTFCRHNRFLERCPICRETLPGGQSSNARARAKRPPRPQASGAEARSGGARGSRAARAGAQVRVYDDGSRRGQDDGYSCGLVPGLRSSEDAARLAGEIAFSAGRLLALGSEPPGLYRVARSLAAQGDVERACWTCLLIAYLGPLQGEDPFGGIAQALARFPRVGTLEGADLAGIATGPRTCHDPGGGIGTLLAYQRWSAKAGSQAAAMAGDAAWSAERRFERTLERLGLLGIARWGRYGMLVTLGRLGIFELRAGSLYFATTATRPARAAAVPADLAMAAAKRVFGIGDSLLLDRRALELAYACSVPIEALEEALANWAAPERASGGFDLDTCDRDALARAQAAIGIALEPRAEVTLDQTPG